MKQVFMASVILTGLAPNPANSADLVEDGAAASAMSPAKMLPAIKGRASVIDGRTLWFPQSGLRVRLAGIDSCALPQWAFDPVPDNAAPALAPVPCGSLAKAWLKRLIDRSIVLCKPAKRESAGDVVARCSTHGQDLAFQMLRVGWGRVGSDALTDPRYLAAERYARSARYGLWGTYMLGMDEWRAAAVDRTLKRRPSADRNLLAERGGALTPPYVDWLIRPRRTDR